MRELLYLVAGCNVVGATGLTTGRTAGIASSQRNAKGDYTIFLSEGIDLTDAVVSVTKKTTATEIAANQSSDTQIDVLTTDLAGNPADVGFALLVARLDIG